MDGRVKAARKQLRTVAAELAALRDRLLGIAAGLPVAPRESINSQDDLDAPPEVRSLIECVLADRIEPAIRELGGTEEAS